MFFKLQIYFSFTDINPIKFVYMAKSLGHQLIFMADRTEGAIGMLGCKG